MSQRSCWAKLRTMKMYPWLTFPLMAHSMVSPCLNDFLKLFPAMEDEVDHIRCLKCSGRFTGLHPPKKHDDHPGPFRGTKKREKFYQEH